jgi:hypothetical protein
MLAGMTAPTLCETRRAPRTEAMPTDSRVLMDLAHLRAHHAPITAMNSSGYSHNALISAQSSQSPPAPAPLIE